MKIKGKRTEVEIPTASQSDIAFLLIIFFIVTSSFAVKSGITIGYPKKEALEREVYINQIGNIAIKKDNIFIGNKMVNEKNFEAELNNFPFNKIIVSIEKGVPYGKVIKVLSYLYNKDLEISLRVEQ